MPPKAREEACTQPCPHDRLHTLVQPVLHGRLAARSQPALTAPAALISGLPALFCPPKAPPPPAYAPAVLADIKRSLPAALVLDLPAGAVFRQSTHVVLLRGQLAAEQTPAAAASLFKSPPVSPRAAGTGMPKTPLSQAFPDLDAAAAAHGDKVVPPALRRASVTSADDGGSDGEQLPAAAAGWEAALTKAAAAAAAPVAPRVLPWLWSPRFRCTASAAAVKLHLQQEWRAGSEGALMLVSLTDAGGVPAGVDEALLAAAEAAQQATAAEAATTIKSHPLDFGSEASNLPDGGPAAGPGGGGTQRAQRAPAPLRPRSSALM